MEANARTCIKRILVPLDPSPYSQSALEFAIALAKRHEAELSGLVVLDIPGIERSIGPVPVGGSYYAERQIAEEERRSEERIRHLLEKFKARCEEAGVAHVEAERQGAPAAQIISEANYFDCLSIGLRTYFRFIDDAGADEIYGTKDDHVGRSLVEVMNHSAVPLLALPLAWQPPAGRMNVLIAFNGSVPSVRSLHDFARLFSPVDVQINLLNSSSDMAEGHFRLDQAERFLAGHGFTEIRKEVTAVPVRTAVESWVSKGVDLVVLGAHSKVGLFDFMAGSVCKDLIAAGTKPLLISH